MKRDVRLTVDPISGADVYEYFHECGARVVYVGMDTSLSSGSISIPYGGGVSAVQTEGFRDVPAFPGSAHFAEHMLFTGGGGKLDKFCALGADVNAETSMTGTTYYVTAGEKFLYAFGDLINMAVKPKFNKDELEKEREIILREKAEDDDIFTRARRSLTDLIYDGGSIRRDIIGDKKSIKKMNSELLKGLYNCAYVPSVMGVSAVSSKTKEEIFGMADAALFGCNESSRPEFKRIKSSLRGGKKITEIKGGPSFMLCGIPYSFEGRNISYAGRQVYSSMLDSMLFDRTEYIGMRFRERGAGIYGPLRSDTSVFFDDMLLSASVSCEDPIAASELFCDLLSEAKRIGAKACFKNAEAKRRSLVADYLSVFDSPSELSLTLSEYAAAGESFFDVARELLNFDFNGFFDFADEFLTSANAHFAAVKE